MAYGDVSRTAAGPQVATNLVGRLVGGGPFQYTSRELRDAHFDLKISPAVFDEVAAELSLTLDHFKVPEREKGEVLDAFGGWKGEVTAGSAPEAVN
jgi:hypothetical protein